ncbi:MAG TPA: Ig-like domain-containing protein [Verrucomicrobiae bacterium]|nr:Ig-like domain-containing protein [Verrucomicrobiae bacterium]
MNALFPSRFVLALGILCLAGAASGQTTFNVTASGNTSYVINGVSDPILTLQRGVTYTFNINATGHPFYIKTVANSTGTGNQYTTGVSGNGSSPGTVTFTVPASAPNTLYYHCSLHSGMGGTLNIVNAANSAPSVSVTNPTSGTVFFAPANVTIQATASDTDGTITNVQFRVGTTILANDASAPYAATTNGLVAGNFTLFAIAADNGGARATNSVNIVVDAPPSVTITNPSNGAFYVAPVNVTIQASASDTDGTVTNVQFLLGSSVVANDTTSPYATVSNGVPAGNFVLTAIATDNYGARATNSVNILVNAPPSVTVTNPLNGASFIAPANITIQATASDTDGTITNIQFLVGGTVLANDSVAPYAAATNGLPEGNYTLAAVASDNRGTRATNSVNISVNANAPPAVRIVFVSVSNFVTIKSTGTNGWSAVPEYQCALSSGNWTVVPNFTNSLVNNTNTTTFDRLEAVCGSSNVFLRIRNAKD